MAKATAFKQILLAACTVAVVAVACFPFTEHIGYRAVALILLLVVSILAMRLGLAAVVTAAVLSCATWDYFFVPPRFTLHIESAEDALFMVMYFIVAMLNGVINYRLRQLELLRREKMEREHALRLYNTLFNSLSHDLRTPISAVLGAADTLLENEMQLSENQRKKLLEEVSAGALRLSEQVENLLNMSRIEAGMIHAQKEWCDVGDLLFGIVKKNALEAANHKVEVSLAENFPLVQLDFGLTEQALQNLLINALRHTPAGTKVCLSAKILGDREGHFEASDEDEELQTVRDAAPQRLVLEVSDNGKGFHPDEIDHVFDKFYRVGATKADGTGLGLFLVRGFTEAQGGSASVRNLPGGGSCFTIEMPTAILNQSIHQV